MFTPSGRFRPGMRLCLSISDYHPKTWNPAWSVSTILTGLLSFMVGDESTAGSVASTEASRRQYAKQSKAYNNKSNNMFIQQYPDLVDANKKEIAAALASQAQGSASSSSNSSNSGAGGGKSKLVPVNLSPVGKGTAADAPVPEDGEGNPEDKARFSRGQKLMCVAVLFVSWLVASKLFASHI